jgi:hypothetical protein
MNCDLLQESTTVDEEVTPIAHSFAGGKVFDLDCPRALLFLPCCSNDFVLQSDETIQPKLRCCIAEVLQDLRSSCVAAKSGQPRFIRRSRSSRVTSLTTTTSLSSAPIHTRICELEYRNRRLDICKEVLANAAACCVEVYFVRILIPSAS